MTREALDTLIEMETQLVVDIGVDVSAQPGRPDESSAPAAIAAIRRAVADINAGLASAVVTNPVAKNVLYRSGFTEPGHTEYLAKLAEDATGTAVHPVMMLSSPELAVVLGTDSAGNPRTAGSCP